ncbi:class I SAM-dependent methyltransferase [Dactylosporangium cerinum]|uniref:Class I SAM-dependent methyltransferase n=1 Tax=Dactylosporangium cerinum TaxID=1434730 RepID=A0ABV9W393_9ACTN
MDDQTGRWRELNQASWDERVHVHLRGPFYDVAGFRDGRDSLKDFEKVEVGDVTGKRLLHLQCHFGLDTLSWAARGARAVGLDFSPAAIEAATGLAAELHLDARFVTADVYHAVAAMAGQTFDIVYTGFGALNWLPDLPRWAGLVAELLDHGGFLYLAEFHPFSFILDDQTGRTVTHDYFDEGPHLSGGSGTYADETAVTEHNVTIEWEHMLGSVVSAIAAAGLCIEFLHEHDHTFYLQRQSLQRDPGEIYRHPAAAPRYPLTYSLRARKP